MVKQWIVLIMMIFSAQSFADQSLEDFIGETVWKATDSYTTSSREEAEIMYRKGYDHSATRIRFRPIFGVEIPWLVKAEVKPTIELIWKK